MQTVHLHPDDNVAIAKVAIEKGATLTEYEGIVARTPIPAMHKVAIVPIAKGEQIRKYNQVIGIASTNIQAGEHVHTHNCEIGEIIQTHEFCKHATPTAYVPENQRASFQGYRRATGKAGTRNYIAVLTTVNCAATVAQNIAMAANQKFLLTGDYPNVDGAASFIHKTGCGMESRGEGYEMFLRILHGYIRHPNVGGLLLVGLGCEVMQVSRVLQEAGMSESDLFRTFTIQDQGGTRKAIDAGVNIINEMLPKINACKRETISASEITVGLQCGGSDAFSGITANPALGAAVDLLVRHGGTGILSETPEIYGAEHLLTRRAVNLDVANKLMERLDWWKEYTRGSGEELNNNPSPGNKAGGLTTILEKSLGAQAKGGSTNLTAVYKYAEPVTEKGFVFMDSPGYDPVSATGQVASGANVICFTTGRGSAYGCKPVPSIKLATNTQIYNHMIDDMDINCGGIMDGEYTVQESGEEIFWKILSIASGEKTKSEELGYGDNEFAPWQIGAVY